MRYRYSVCRADNNAYLFSAMTLAEILILAEAKRLQDALAVLHWKAVDLDENKVIRPTKDQCLEMTLRVRLKATAIATDTLFTNSGATTKCQS